LLYYYTAVISISRQCLILNVEERHDVATIRFSGSDRTDAGAASPLRFARAQPPSLAMQSSRLTDAMMVFALLTAAALGLLADRDVGTSVVLAGVAIFGVLMVVVLLADALTRPLVELADAVQALARSRSTGPNHESDMQHDNVVALQPQAQPIRTAVAGLESASRPKALCESINATAVGTYIDIVIQSDRRERYPGKSRDRTREDVTRWG
jgi:hypothetical protein